MAFAALQSARTKARNAKRLVDIEQYITAFELIYDRDKAYPDTGIYWRCLGKYPAPNHGKCWDPANPANESSALNDALDDFLSDLPPGDWVRCDAEFQRRGYIYQGDNETNDLYCQSPFNAKILYLMEGVNQSCGKGKVLNGNYRGSNACTICAYCFSGNYTY